jgi:hypothetical protein
MADFALNQAAIMAIPLPPPTLDVRSAPVFSKIGLGDAFLAAYGARQPVVRQVQRPRSDRAAANVSLTVSPRLLVRLSQERYALISAEDQAVASHAEPGSVSVAYLQRGAGGWRLERRWDELAWIGDDGHSADGFTVRYEGTATPLVFANRDVLNQGQHESTGWAISLSASGPKLLGAFPESGSQMADNDWWALPSRATKVRFTSTTNYVPHAESLVATPKVKVPAPGAGSL